MIKLYVALEGDLEEEVHALNGLGLGLALGLGRGRGLTWRILVANSRFAASSCLAIAPTLASACSVSSAW